VSVNNLADAKAMAYDTMWELWEARMVDLRTERDRLQRQVRQLQEANTNECERRREADRLVAQLVQQVQELCLALAELLAKIEQSVTIETTTECRIDAPDLARSITQAQAQGGAHE
jgi:hypothetical protein